MKKITYDMFGFFFGAVGFLWCLCFPFRYGAFACGILGFVFSGMAVRRNLIGRFRSAGRWLSVGTLVFLSSYTLMYAIVLISDWAKYCFMEGVILGPSFTWATQKMVVAGICSGYVLSYWLILLLFFLIIRRIDIQYLGDKKMEERWQRAEAYAIMMGK